MLLFLSLFLLSAFASPLASNNKEYTTIFVNGISGNDDAACGLDVSTPCRTLNHAVDNRIHASDELSQTVETINITGPLELQNMVNISYKLVSSSAEATSIILSSTVPSTQVTYGPAYINSVGQSTVENFMIQLPATATDNIAILNSGGPLTVANCTFKFVQEGTNLFSHSAIVYGIANDNITIQYCTVYSMKIRRASFIFKGPQRIVFKNVTFTGVIYDTSESEEQRALIYAQTCTSLVTDSITVSDSNGGDYLIYSQNVYNNTLIGSTFERCSALSDGIYLLNPSNISLSNTVFEHINMTTGSLITVTADGEQTSTGKSYIAISNLTTQDIRGTSFQEDHPTVLLVNNVNATAYISNSNLYFTDGRQDDVEPFKGFAISLADLDIVDISRITLAVHSEGSAENQIQSRSNSKYPFCSWSSSMLDVSNCTQIHLFSSLLANSTFGALSLSDTTAKLDAVEFSGNTAGLSSEESELFPSVRHNFICGTDTTLEVSNAIVAGSRSNGNTDSLWGLQESGCTLSGEVSKNSIFFIPRVTDYNLTIGTDQTTIDFNGDLFIPCALSVVFTMTKGKAKKQTITTKTVTVTNVTSQHVCHVEVPTSDIRAQESDVKVTFSLCNSGHATEETYVLKKAEESHAGRIALIIVLTVLAVAVIAAGCFIAVICIRRKGVEIDGYFKY